MSNKIMRLESIVLFVACLYVFFRLDVSWFTFILYFAAIDLSMLGYLRSSWLGGITYNLGHTFVFPGLLAIIALINEHPTSARGFFVFAIVWLAHISLDRALGFGLKQQDFQHTHLGVIGKKHP